MAVQIPWSVFYSGVDHRIPGNGGPTCVGFVSGWQRTLETCAIVGYAVLLLLWTLPRLQLATDFSVQRHSVVGRRLVLALLCLVFGAEIGFKCASRSAIYLLNPCHMVTAVQIWLLLVEPDNPLVCAVFRLHLYALTGPTLALAFPVLNTRQV